MSLYMESTSSVYPVPAIHYTSFGGAPDSNWAVVERRPECRRGVAETPSRPEAILAFYLSE